MPEYGQREPGSGGTAHRGRPEAGQARQNAGGESPPGDGQDHAGTPRPDAPIPALDEDQLAALREIGRERDRVSADRQAWRQALPAGPPPGEYPEASKVRPALNGPGCLSMPHHSTPRADPVRKISLIPRGQALGVTFQAPRPTGTTTLPPTCSAGSPARSAAAPPRRSSTAM